MVGENIMFRRVIKDPQFVFLSHNTKDKSYGDLLRELLIAVDVQNSDIIYTAHPKNGIPAGENIYNYLSGKMEKSSTVFFLLSEDYFKSVVCLNEMGASWVTKNNYVTFFVPGFDEQSQAYLNCCLDQKKIAIVLNGDEICYQGLLECIRELARKMKLPLSAENLEEQVAKTCAALIKLTPVNETYTATIVALKKHATYVFCKLDRLLQTGEKAREGESHWLQLSSEFFPNAESIQVGKRIKFKVKEVNAFQKENYGTQNFRNIYAENDSLEII